MKLDLNELCQEISLWKNLLKGKDEEIESLQGQLLFAQKQNEVLDQSHLSFLNEVAELNSAVASLRNSLKSIELFEVDRKQLLEEKQKLKNSVESLEKLYQNETKKVKKQLLEIEEKNKENTKILLLQIENEAAKEVENIRTELKKKENTIEDFKKQITELLNDKNQDILKIKIQYEEKIGKLKQQKSKIQTCHGVQMNDVFRQKYIQLKKESEEKILKLEEKIESLQLLTQSIKSKSGCPSLSSVLLTANKPNISTTNEVATQTVNVSPELPKELNEVLHDDNSDFISYKKTFNKTQAVLPRKRKLFNLVENFY